MNIKFEALKPLLVLAVGMLLMGFIVNAGSPGDVVKARPLMVEVSR